MDGPMLGHGFECAATQTDRLLEAAGIELEMTYNWVIGDDPESSLAGSNEDWGVLLEFLQGYHDWLADTHPDVAANVDYEWRNVVPAAESVPTALEYVDEFVNQSDQYPLTVPVPQMGDGALP